MICPYCEAYETKVTNTIVLGFITYRRHRCKDPECQAVSFSKGVECEESEYIKAREKRNEARKAAREKIRMARRRSQE